MRISDWSSDVCSSDLSVHIAAHSLGTIVAQHFAVKHANRVRSLALFGPFLAPPDRKSVVEGKSVSVRVDLGGRRIIKKKHKNNIYNSPHMQESIYINRSDEIHNKQSNQHNKVI